jgi:hypothetical protein
MAEINLNPYTAESDAIARRLRMAEALNQQAMQPMELPTQAGVRVSPYAGLAKMLQGYTSGLMQNQALGQQEALSKRYAADTGADFQSLMKALTAPGQAAVPEGAPTFTPNVGAGELADNARMTMQPERNEMGEIIQPGQPGAGNFGITPGAPAQAARLAGQLTPEGFGSMRTPMGQQQYMAQLLGQMKPREPIKLGKDESLFDPVTLKPIYQPTAAKNKPILVGNVLVDPDTLKPVYTGERAPRTGVLGVYDEYVRQEKEANRIPKSIEQFETAQRIAGRTQAAPRERFVYDVQRGGRVNLDTGELTPITQGGLPIGVRDKPLPTGEVEKITAIDVSLGNQKRLSETFQDKYGGYPLKAGGELANVLGGKFGGENEAQAQWWASHEANDNVARNALFGASLTAGEQKAWDKTTINPGMSPSMIKTRMTERQDLIDAKRNTTIGNLDKAGYDVKGFKEKSDFYGKPSNSPPVSALKEGQVTSFANGQSWTMRNGQPVQVK